MASAVSLCKVCSLWHIPCTRLEVSFEGPSCQLKDKPVAEEHTKEMYELPPVLKGYFVPAGSVRP